MTVPVRFLFGALLLLSVYGESKADTRYDVAPTPAWVVPAVLPEHKTSDADSRDGGTDFVLVDHQIRLDALEHHYSRFVTRLTNVSGIEDESQITIDFDPKIERLHLHSILIKRGAQAIDQLRSGRVRVIQRESNLEDQVVDGELTFHLVMSDVRVGDMIDCSYTIERKNIEWGSRNFGRLQTRWDKPVDLLRVRLLSPADTPLHTFSYPTEAPVVSIVPGLRILEWSKQNVPAVHYEKEAPAWFQQYGTIEFSQFSNWGEVAAAAIPLYAVTAAPSPELKALTARLSMAASKAQRATDAMKFVQEEIRYTGIEEGEAAFRPTPPNVVLARRYGDCKDKTLLAITLLKALGIEAAPALVSTRWKSEAANHLPSPGLMNHVVVRVVVDGRVYWFDATSTGQGGQLENFTQASFGKALVISPGVVALEAMQAVEVLKPLARYQVTFDLTKGFFAESALNVTTTYFNAEADRMRRRLRAKGTADLADRYLRFYKDQYAGTRSTAPLKVTDKLDANELSVEESYAIKDAFETDKEGRQRLYVNADAITDALDAPKLRERTTPFAVDFPNYLSTEIQILVPKDIDVDAEAVKIDTKHFHYASTVGHRDKVVTLDYEYKALTDQVSVAELPAHIKDLERARDDTYYHISRSAPGTVSTNQKNNLLALKFFAALAALFLLLRFVRFVLTVQAYLTSTLTQARASGCLETEVPEREAAFLRSLDAELTGLSFEAAGYVRCTSLYTRFDKPDYFRVLYRPDVPMTAYVTRHHAPEYGAYVRVWFETEFANGVRLQTMDGASDGSLSPAGVLAETVKGASVLQLVRRHEERVKARKEEGAGANEVPPGGFAERISAGYAAIRADWLRYGWIRATKDPDLDRVTIRGAGRLARAAIRMYGARLAGSALLKASRAAASNDRAIRADADFVAAWHLAKVPRSAQGRNWSAILYSGSWLFVSLAILDAVSGAFAAGMFLSAVLLHEAAHLAVLGGRSASPGLLYFLPYTGLIKAEALEEFALLDRVSIVLAGPMVGLLIGVILLGSHALWPTPHLQEAASMFILVNSVLLVPYPGTDGFRVLSAITAPGSRMRPVIQLVSVVGVLTVGFESNSQFLILLGFMLALWFGVQLRTFNLLRIVARQIPQGSDWDGVMRAAFMAMTGAAFERWGAQIRQMRALGMVNDLIRPTSSRREKTLCIVGYGCCALLAVCEALQVVL